MKNIILSLIVTVLLVIAYFHEELGKQKREEQLLEQQRVVSFNPQMIDKIVLPKVQLVKRDHKWFVADLNYPASSLAIENLLKHLHAIHQVKMIEMSTLNQSDFFTHQDHIISLSSFGKEWKYKLGDVSELTGNFYFADLSNGIEKLYLARDTSTFEGFYKTELELYLNQYVQLKNMILASSQAFLEPKVFYELDIDRLDSIKIDNKWNRWFEVKLDKGETIPAIVKGLKYHNLKMQVQNLINEVVHEGIAKEGVLGEVISTIKFKDMTKSIEAKLYNQLDGRQGSYVKYDGSDWIYKLKDDSKNLFFMNVQDFWDKKVHYPIKVKELSRLDFAIGVSQENSYRFYVDDLERFEFKTQNTNIKNINIEHMNFLFHILFGLENFQQASRVDSIQNSSNGKNTSIFVKLLDVLLRLDFYSDQVVVVNLSENYQLYFDTSFSRVKISDIDDFFALK